MDLWKDLNAVFCKVFDNDDIQIEAHTTADDVDGWDSLSHAMLIVAIESRFGITFEQRELLTFKNVGDMYMCLAKKLRIG